jgi:hypothetical protein
VFLCHEIGFLDIFPSFQRTQIPPSVRAKYLGPVC